MIVGENSRSGDLDVNITKAKQMTNVRSNADVLVRLNPPHKMSLDRAIEYIQEGECVEVDADRRAHPQGRAGGRCAGEPALQASARQVYSYGSCGSSRLPASGWSIGPPARKSSIEPQYMHW